MAIQASIPTSEIEKMKQYNFKTSDGGNNYDVAEAVSKVSSTVETINLGEEESGWDSFWNGVGDFVEGAWDNVQESGAYIVGGWMYVYGGMNEYEIAAEEEQINADNRATDTIKPLITSVGNITGEYLGATWDLITGEITLTEYITKCTATTENAIVGIFEGVGRWGEKAWDGLNLTSNYTIGKIFQWSGAITEDEFNSEMEEVTDDIASNNTKYIYDAFYEDTEIGQSIYKNSLAPDQTRYIGNMTGEIGMNIGMAEVGGKGLMITSAGVTGYGEGAEIAYASGASVNEGIVVGLLNGGYNMLQYSAGAKINELNPFSSAVNNAALHVALDSATGATDGAFQPLLETIYADGYYDSDGNYIKFTGNESWNEKYKLLFEANGGWSTVGKYAAIGGAFSAASEAIGLSKHFRNSDDVDNIKSDYDGNGYWTGNAVTEELPPMEKLQPSNYDENGYWTGNAVTEDVPPMEKLKPSNYDENGYWTGNAVTEDVPPMEKLKPSNYDENGYWTGNAVTEDVPPMEKLQPSNYDQNGFKTNNTSTENIPKVKTETSENKKYKKYSNVREWEKQNIKVRTDWENSLTPEELRVLKDYTSEFENSSYKTMNGLLRGDLIDWDEGVIKFRTFGGTTIKYTFDEWEQKYGETVYQFIGRTTDDIVTLDNALSKYSLKENTTIYRGLGYSSLQKDFGIYEGMSETEILKRLQSKGGYTDYAFMSGTPDPKKGFTYKKVIFEMDCEAGMKVGDLTGINSGEAEILIGAGEKFEVYDAKYIKHNDGTTKLHIYMRHVE